MTTNDVLRRVRYALRINDATMVQIFRLSGYEADQSAVTALLKKEDEPGYVACSNEVLGLFLDGLILQKRGKKEIDLGQPNRTEALLTNNAIVKKLRIALELKEDDMLGILKLAGFTISKSELSALFRKEGHKHYKECGDQFCRNFLEGLALRFRV
jgi:uncharacterized protein YehS (DUF1456 family)